MSRFRRFWTSAVFRGHVGQRVGIVAVGGQIAHRLLHLRGKLLTLLFELFRREFLIKNAVHQVIDPAEKVAGENDLGTNPAKLLPALAGHCLR